MVVYLFNLFSFAIILPILRQFVASDYPFCIFCMLHSFLSIFTGDTMRSHFTVVSTTTLNVSSIFWSVFNINTLIVYIELFVLCTFSFDHCIVCSSSIYGFWLHLWYLQTLLKSQLSFCFWNSQLIGKLWWYHRSNLKYLPAHFIRVYIVRSRLSFLHQFVLFLITH